MSRTAPTHLAGVGAARPTAPPAATSSCWRGSRTASRAAEPASSRADGVADVRLERPSSRATPPRPLHHRGGLRRGPADLVARPRRCSTPKGRAPLGEGPLFERGGYIAAAIATIPRARCSCRALTCSPCGAVQRWPWPCWKASRRLRGFAGAVTDLAFDLSPKRGLLPRDAGATPSVPRGAPASRHAASNTNGLATPSPW